MTITVIIQARMGSSRLPKKILKKINGEPILYHVIKQTKKAKLVDDIIIATTNLEEDNEILDYCKSKKIKCYRGSSTDLLDRYYKCAKKFNVNIIVRITSDCPLIDPDVIDKIIKKFLENKFDYVSNNIDKKNKKWINSTCNFPQGMTVEVSNFKNIEKAWKKAKKPSEREHVFPYIQFNSEFSKFSIKSKEKLDFIRCTIDRKEDLNFIKKIMKGYSKNKIMHIKDIKKNIKKNPELLNINKKIPFDEGYLKSIDEDKNEDLLKMNKKILIYVNGNKEIGMGHVYRSKNLAEGFKKKKYQIEFLTQTPKIEKIIGKDFKINKFSNFNYLKKYIDEIDSKIIIIDQLKIKTQLLSLFIKKFNLVVGIDYTGKNKMKLPKCINSLYQISGKQGENTVSNFKFAILNKNFLNKKPIKIKKNPRSILVLQGGSDTHCFIPKILNAINSIPKDIEITTILGPAFSCGKTLSNMEKKLSKKVKILKNIKNMAKEMKNHDIAITGGGLSLLELSRLGIPSIVICSEKFEVETAKMMENEGFGRNLGYYRNITNEKILKNINKLIENYKDRKKMNQKGVKIIDGKGIERVIEQIMKWENQV